MFDMLAFPSKPPKDYGKRKKRTIGLFVWKTVNVCAEILRIRITPQRDVYVIPYPTVKPDVHESFHSSGEFHWRFRGKKEYPISGALDLVIAFRFQLFANSYPCMCIRADTERLTLDEIAYGLRFLFLYIPIIDIDSNAVKKYADMLYKRGFIRFVKYSPPPWFEHIKNGLLTRKGLEILLEYWNRERTKHMETIKKLLKGTKYEKDYKPLDKGF